MTDNLHEIARHVADGPHHPSCPKASIQTSEYRCTCVKGRARAALAAAPQPMGCGYPCGYDCNGACFDAAAPQPAPAETFQNRVEPWMTACFGPEISGDRMERADRLLEEVLELLQSGDYPRERIAALTGYVWSRPKGEPAQEVGGVMVTLAAYCLAHSLDMHEAGETELARIWTKIEKIRAKQAAKPAGSALPQVWPEQPAPVDREALVDVIREARRKWQASWMALPLDESFDGHIADALLARGLRLPGPETMAWGVVGKDGEVHPQSIGNPHYGVKDHRGERVVRLAIRKLNE